MISRTQVREVMANVDVSALPAPKDRNRARRIAVEEFLNGERTLPVWAMGKSEAELILSDIHNYREWEAE